MAESFAPTVMVHGVAVTPEGWMWVLAYALAGVEWALETVRDPAFDLDGKIRDYNRRKREHFARVEIAELETRLVVIRASLGMSV